MNAESENNISLVRFLTYAEFGGLYRGIPRLEVESRLGLPEMTGGDSKKKRTPQIYAYGNLEIYFDHETRSYMVSIFIEGLRRGEFGFGKVLQLRDWDLRIGEPIASVRDYLTLKNIPYTEHEPVGSLSARIFTNNKAVEIVFDEEGHLEAFSSALQPCPIGEDKCR